ELYRPLTTWSKYILTADMEFEKYYGAPATKRRKLYNGALRTDLYQYWSKKDRSKPLNSKGFNENAVLKTSKGG
ncbi:class I SAM-dependent RNA methyltransferase, partial [Salmonella enterica subsp. enterica serovar Istanbul]|nr:class I SAM-dependent RNA methyltransferase [Salmonella enterica subsp. enterica serovar Istanbul]